MANKPKLGTGARFKALSARLAAQGVRDPDALAATIGRRAHPKTFQRLAARARARAGK